MRGQLTAIFVVLAIIALVMWRTSVSSTATEKLEKRQAALVKYTGEVNKYVNDVQITVREMLGAPFNTANPEGLASLEKSAPEWAETIEAQAALIQALVPPEELVPANVTLQQSFLAYSSSAKLYEMVSTEATNKDIQELLDRAMEVREQAGILLGTAIGQLDKARIDAELAPSRIPVPTQMTPIVPTPAPIESSKSGNGTDEDKKKSDG
jgi:hypothetical protein